MRPQEFFERCTEYIINTGKVFLATGLISKIILLLIGENQYTDNLFKQKMISFIGQMEILTWYSIPIILIGELLFLAACYDEYKKFNNKLAKSKNI